ncbi:MAG: hypothetical protein Kow00114_34880 [Kiloniellaceae bacterium]
MGVIIRNAKPEDMDQIMAVEESWPEMARAPRDKFETRMKKYPEGFFVWEQDGRILATITAMPFVYDPKNAKQFSNWDDVTNKGYLFDIGAPGDYNALYIVSGIIEKDARGGDIFEHMVMTEVELARKLGYKYVVAGAVIPGYKRYCVKNDAVPAHEYVFMKRGNRLVDPLLDMYQKIGFAAPDANHVVREYFPDDASLNYAAIVVHKL